MENIILSKDARWGIKDVYCIEVRSSAAVWYHEISKPEANELLANDGLASKTEYQLIDKR